MKLTPMFAAVLLACVMPTAVVNAQPMYDNPDMAMPAGPMHGNRDMGPMPPRMPRMAPPRPPAHQFPSPDELARVVPREPMTEARIQERFAKQRTQLNDMIERDREAAKKYAEDFAKYQKQQADALTDIMAKAEMRRTDMLKQLDEREQQTLESFRQYQQAKQQAEQADNSAAAPAQ